MSTSYIQTEREPTSPCPWYKWRPTAQQHSHDDDGQRQHSNIDAEKSLPTNHHRTNQEPQKKDIKALARKEDVRSLIQNWPTLTMKEDLSYITHKHTNQKGTRRLSAPKKPTSNTQWTSSDGAQRWGPATAFGCQSGEVTYRKSTLDEPRVVTTMKHSQRKEGAWPLTEKQPTPTQKAHPLEGNPPPLAHKPKKKSTTT